MSVFGGRKISESDNGKIKASDYVNLFNQRVAERTKKQDDEIERLQKKLELLEIGAKAEIRKAQISANSALQVALVNANLTRNKLIVLHQIAELKKDQEIEKTTLSANSHEKRIEMTHQSKMCQLAEKAKLQRESDELKAKLKLDHAMKLIDAKNVKPQPITSGVDFLTVVMGIMSIPAIGILGIVGYSVLHWLMK